MRAARRPHWRTAIVAAFAWLACAAAQAAALPLQACRLVGLDHDAQCGVLKRPLDPARPDGTQIDLHVVVIPALARQKLPDPIFFFAGGPGQSAVGLAGTIEHLTSRLAARRDLVLIDQRGTGHSAPLNCDVPTPDEALARALDRARAAAALDACRVALQKLPWGDLRFYTTTIAMADADAVRAALGADRIDLIGISYGTRAALEYLRAYPTHVRRVVIDGVAPPDMVLPDSDDIDADAALAALFRDCAAETACAKAHPSLAQTWQRLLLSLPKAIDFVGPVSGEARQVTMTRAALRGLVRPGLYQPTLGALLPYAIEQAAAGRYESLMALATGDADLSEGEHFSVICAEDAPRMSPADRADGDHEAQAMYCAACASWPRGDVPAAFYTIPRSAAPVLLLSGGLDPVTPPRHAERVAKALGPMARSVVVANNGHNVTAIACMRDAVFHFINAATDAEAQAVDMGCAAKMPRPLAFQPPLPSRARAADNDPNRFDDSAPHTPGVPPPGMKDAR
ncbi:alpha/beta hydrolase [Scleromatobacter humisilvae]|uniref:Alpha/beta hydrolase n=1 Tax=Scleromatobacter humisilvae TaxID=2897159 RepID=A0A9X1YMH0_9BURK|nr:alpha/beta hydrolase [Scleromatobacter humisilvae]MCK9687508.1 alpha/beta hydrolase [Scleromatobacter humisilvae]